MSNRMTRARAPMTLILATLALAAGCGDGGVVGINQPPIVSIQFPQPGNTVSGVGFIVQATATDDRDVRRVEISLDGVVVATLDEAPYEAFITSLGVQPGTYPVRVRAFDEQNAFRDAIVSVSVSARAFRRLTAPEAGIRHTEPAWHPQAVQIAYARGGTGANTTKNVYVVSSLATDGLGQRVTDSALQDGNPSFSPDGAWIAFESNRTGFYQILALGLASGEVSPLTNIGFANQRRPSWGKTEGIDSWIVYDTDRSPASASRRDLYMVKVAVDADTVTIIEPIGQPDLPADTNNSDDVAPQWAASGALGVSSNRSAGTHAVTLLDPFQPQGARVVNGTNQFLEEEYAPSFSPHGTFVAFTERITGAEKVFVVAVEGDGSVRYEVAPGSAGFSDAFDPAWSPAGSKIAFVSTRSGTAEIWILE
ncbi:MAG: Ig-like domain-containing protein [bacterium]